MDRAEKRRLERERQKLNGINMKEDQNNKLWYSQLPVNRKIFIGKFVERRTIENDNLVAAIMDKCMISSMDDNTSIDIRLMKKVIDDCNGYILNYKEFLDKYGDGGFDMIENDKIRDKVIEKMKKEIEGGITKVKCMAWLKKEYKLPAAELSDMWVQCKIELDQNKYDGMIMGNTLDKAREHMLEYVSKGESKLSCVGMIKNEFKFSLKEIEDLYDQCIKQAESVVTGPIDSIRDGLKVIDQVKVIEGKYGCYYISREGLRFSNDIKLVNEDIAYKTKEEVLKIKTNEMEIYNARINKINDELRILNEERELFMNKFNELEAVFDM